MSKQSQTSETKAMPTCAGPALGALILVAYSGSLWNGFTNWDDPNLILENPAIRSLSPDQVLSIFTPRVGETFQPVRVLSYALDFALWGHHPFGYHAVNLLFHCLATCFLLRLLLLVLPAVCGDHRIGLRAAWLATALWALHPINVEAVAWASSRKYVLLAMFAFAGMHQHLSGRKLFGLICISLAALSSPFGVMIPALLALLEFSRSGFRKGILRNAGWFGLQGIAMLCLATLLMNVLSGGETAIVRDPLTSHPVLSRLVWLGAIPLYLRNLIAPFWLNNLYTHDIGALLSSTNMIMGLVLLAGAGLWLRADLRKRGTGACLTLGWCAIAFLPVSNVIPISTLFADRYAYLPALGLFVGTSLFWAKLSDSRPGLARLSVAVLVVLALLSASRCRVWKSSETLWADSLAESPTNAVAANALANALAAAGQLEEANGLYRRAVSLRPGYARAHFNLGRLAQSDGYTDRAIRHYRFALQSDPGAFEARLNLTALYVERELWPVAAPHLRQLLQAHADFAESWYLAGMAAYGAGDHVSAQRLFEHCLRVDPEHGRAWFKLGVVFQRRRNGQMALAAYQRALPLLPDHVPCHYNAARILHAFGRHEEACRLLQTAGALAPQDKDIQRWLATCESQ